MSVTYIGVRVPSDRGEFLDENSYSEYEDLSGMEYSVYEHHANNTNECLIGTSHDAVGLVTWWRADTFDEAEEWVGQQKDDARDAAADESYSRVLAVFGEHTQEIALATLEGLARVGALEGDWDSETVEIALHPIIDLLERYQIPNICSSSEDAVAFWQGVALKHGAL